VTALFAKRYFLITLFTSALALCATFAQSAEAAQMSEAPRVTYPTKPVTIVVPFTPGGSPDLLARTVGQKLSEAWGKPVVIENRPGAGGNIAAAYVAKAPADGHTLLMGTDGPLAINTFLYEKLPFDPVKDFSPIGLLASMDFLLVTQPGFPARNVKELIALATTRRPPLTYGSAGKGSQHHLGMELFKRMANLELVHVPYKGVMPAVSDVMGGHVSMMFVSLSSGIGHVQSGKLKAIAVTGRERSPLVPELPTLAESGLPGFELRAWFGLLAPAGTPQKVVISINADIARALGSSDVKRRLGDEGFELQAGSADSFANLLRTEAARWKQLADASGIRAE
jgi:tripartite-type tricarboxylate transporter receptor subunit TctC